MRMIQSKRLSDRLPRIVCAAFALAAAFAAAAAVSVFSASAATVTTYTEGDYTYKISKESAVITKCATTVSGEITVPSSLGGYPVTELSNNSFYNCKKITRIVLPEGIKKLGTSVFWKCSALQSVVLPQSLSVISSKTFNECTALTGIDFGGVREISSYAFAGCTSLRSVDVPEGVDMVWEFAFSGCTALESVSYPSTLKDLMPRACDGCYSLTRFSVDPDCPYYTSADGIIYSKDMSVLVNAPAGLEGAFTVPDGVLELGKYSFKDCEKITAVTVPDSVETVGWEAFLYCYGLEKITVGSGAVIIGGGCFGDCSALKEVDLRMAENALIDTCAFYNCTALERIVLPDTVTAIGSQAFCGDTALAEIVIPDTVVSFDENIFEQCGEQLTVICSDSSAAAAYAEQYGIAHSAPVSAPVRGDFDGDGRLSNSDAVYLLRTVMIGEEYYPIAQSGDVNGDGKTDSADAVYLLRSILLGEAYYPLF